jgi:hypothetical protein
VNGPDVSLEMLAAVEAFSTALYFAHVQTRTLRVCIAGGTSAHAYFCGHPAPTAFLREVGNGYREYDT